MKDFLRFTFATITGIVVASIILVFIGTVILISAISSDDTETIIRKNSILMLDFNGELAERTVENPLDILLGNEFNTYGLNDILSSIKKAKENKDIKGIYLQATNLSASYASLQEVRDALVDFKSGGKFIIAYGDYYTQKLYYLSSVADKVLLNPRGTIEWKGLASKPVFFKELLQKIGIEMQVFKVGTYKSAVEPYIFTEMSPENRRQVTEYITSIWNHLVNDVSQSRDIGVDTLNRYADRMLTYHPTEELVKCGLADTLIYKSDVRDYLKSYMQMNKDDRLTVLGLKEMINVKSNIPKDKSENIIAVYYAHGTIDDRGIGVVANEEGILSEKVIKDLLKLKDDKGVKAVVLRVNSPGGSAYGSEQIWVAVNELKKEKPVVVSMGDYAASGGYYISCSADCIVAEPTTLTGSIGIFGIVPNVGKLADKAGVKFDVVKTNKYSDFGSSNRPLRTDEQALLQMMINQGYDIFLTRCAEGRGMPKEGIEKIAQGRVWTGVKVQELGLVDELGGIDRALEIAVQKANVENYTVIAYPKKKNFLSSLLESKPDNYVESKLLKSKLGDYYNEFVILKNMGKNDFVQARLPVDFNIQ
ncbi:Protease 4 [termite gut metagenome]|uniref:Protease 4 n=1 Tax=termite gut metagenome TaxID=433724 RepID=A0A5J4S9Q0_9ZZZZ